MKKIVIVAVVVISAISFGAYKSFYGDPTPMSDAMMSNLEALSFGESAYPCPDGCIEWKGNSGGGIACDCNRYIGSCKRRCS